MAPTLKKNGEGRQGDESHDERVEWSKELLNILCDLCLQYVEKSKGKRGEVTSKKLLWAKIVPEFQKRTNLSWNKSKLKNKLDGMRGSWSLWKQLKGRETGLRWDSSKGTIDASEEWWASKIMENPRFEACQQEGIELDLEYKLDSIYLRSSHGGVKHSPTSAHSQGRMNFDISDAYVPSSPCNKPTLYLDYEKFGGNSCHVNNAWNEVWRGQQMDENIFPTPTPNHSPVSYPQASQNEVDLRKRCKTGLDNDSSQSNKCVWSESSKRGGGGVAAAMTNKIDEMMKLIVDFSNESMEVHAPMLSLMKLMTINTPKHLVIDGYAKLCSLPDLDPGSSLFYFACMMIEDAQKWSIFFELPDDQKVGYIKFLYEDYEPRIDNNDIFFVDTFPFPFIQSAEGQ